MAPSWTMAPSWLSTLWPHASDAGSSSSSSSSSSVAEYIGLPVKLPNAPWPAPPADPEKGLEPAATTTTTTSATPHGCSFPRIRTRRFFVFLVTYVLLVIAALYVLRDLGYIQRWRSVEPATGQPDATAALDDPHSAVADLQPFPTDDVPAEVEDEKPPPHESIDKLPSDPVQAWGIVKPEPGNFNGGLIPWAPKPQSKPKDQAYSSLGLEADEVYNYAYPDMERYDEQLRDVAAFAFPTSLKQQLLDGLRRYNHKASAPQDWDAVKEIWQTDRNPDMKKSGSVKTWIDDRTKKEGWHHQLYDDKEAQEWMDKTFSEKHGENNVHYLWNNLPAGILRADLFRYLMLLVNGGIYTDTDTRLVRPPSQWGHGQRLWKGGEGWMDATQRSRVSNGESIDDVLGRPSIVVGIEADVGVRDDWHKWYPRPLQFCQWTMAAAPNHPITLSAVLRVLHASATANEWARVRWSWIKGLRSTGEWDKANDFFKSNVLSTPSDGGPVGVMDWTGPGVWTDSVLSYLSVNYGVKWTDLREIRHPLRIGDVVILPVTGFSPGVGQFGAGEPEDNQAMVYHLFRGSWKHQGKEGSLGAMGSIWD